ncbi:MAG: ComF family protein [Planctomycetota bacterium]
MHAFKFHGMRCAATPLGAALARRLSSEDWIADIEAVVPVPLHAIRERERGYNQSALLAREVGARLGLPVMPKVLARARNTPPQSLLGREERLRNPRGAFRLLSPGRLPRRCLLVDDIMTTGTTVSECAAVLREGGAERIYVAVVAR